MRSLTALAGLAVLLFGTGCSQTTTVKQCRADAQQFADENASFEAEYDTQFGTTTVGQLSMSDLLSRDNKLMTCMTSDPSRKALYRDVLNRNNFIESGRFLKFMLDTQQMPNFAAWEKRQQSTDLANYRTGEN